MSRKILRQFTPIFLAVLLIASPAHANTILPLFFMSWMAMVLALLPIIVIETIVLSVRAGTSLWESVIVATVGNLASTFIGIPVALILHAIFRASLDDTPKRLRTAWEKFRMVVWHVQYAYDEEGRLPDWMWPSGCLVLMVPFFLASWLSESWVARILLDGYSARGLDQAVFGANLVTYGLLVALLSALLVWAIRNPSVPNVSNFKPDAGRSGIRQKIPTASAAAHALETSPPPPLSGSVSSCFRCFWKTLPTCQHPTRRMPTKLSMITVSMALLHC